MKLLYIVSALTLSTSHLTGAATHIISVIKGLEKLGVEIRTVIAGDQQSSGQDIIKKLSSLRKFFPLGIRTLKRDISYLLHDRNWAKKILDVVESFQPDIIYERTAYLHMVVNRIAKKSGVPVVIEVNSPASEIKFLGGSLLLPLALYIERRNLLSADAVITVSNAMKDYLTGRGAEPQKVYVVRNAADREISKLSGNTIKKPDSDIVIGHVSSFANWYRIDILIKAFAIAKKSYPKLRLFIIGDGPSSNSLKNLARKFNVADTVIFTGRRKQEEVFDILINDVDIAVSTNISWYGSPTKIFEYGALGKPVIVFQTPAIAEVIEHEKTGLLVSSKEPNELSCAIIRLIDNPELRLSLAKNWQRKVLSEYTWDQVALKTLDICKKSLIKMYKNR